MAGDYDFLACLRQVQKLAEVVLSLKGAELWHFAPLHSSLS
jgi:hypothetical protein